MKAFFSACAVFLILTAAVVASGVFLGRSTDLLIAMTERIPAEGGEGAEETIGELSARWEKVKGGIVLIVNRNDTDKVDLCLLSLKAALEAHDAGEFAVRLAGLRDALFNLRRSAAPFG